MTSKFIIPFYISYFTLRKVTFIYDSSKTKYKK